MNQVTLKIALDWRRHDYFPFPQPRPSETLGCIVPCMTYTPFLPPFLTSSSPGKLQHITEKLWKPHHLRRAHVSIFPHKAHHLSPAGSSVCKRPQGHRKDMARFFVMWGDERDGTSDTCTRTNNLRGWRHLFPGVLQRSLRRSRPRWG